MARQARSGRPRWKVEAISPALASATATATAMGPNQVARGMTPAAFRMPSQNSMP